MISLGKFAADLNFGCKLLEDVDLAIYRNHLPARGASAVARIRAAESYPAEYAAYIETQSYDVLLDDGSLFFFRRDPGENTELSYGFLEAPHEAMSYTDFLEEYFGVSADSELNAWDQYEEYRSQLLYREHVLPLRYDWSPKLYREGAHPAGHLHLGFRRDVRIALDCVLAPSHFMCFVVRQLYLDRWERTVSRSKDVANAADALARTPLDASYRVGRDLLELRLSMHA